MKEFDIVILDNGIRCAHRYTERPVAYMSLTIGSGTRDELSDAHGVAHLVEHLMFKGTSHHKAYYINSALDIVGGELNAFTSKEETVLHATCLVNNVAKGAELLCDMVFNSTFASSDVDKEREVIIDEINSYKDSPAELIFDEFEELLFAGSSLGRNILGDKKKLKRIKSADLKHFCQNNYSTDRIIFALSSSLSTKKFEALCRKVFGQIEGRQSTLARTSPKRVELFDIERNKRSYQTHVVIGGYAPSVFDESRLAAALLLNAIGGPSALSRMNLILREKYALTYSAEASFSPFTDSGLFTLYFSCENHKVARAEKLLRAEISRFASAQISENELNKYKRQMIGQLLISNDNSESSMMAVAKGLLLYGECESTLSIVDRVNSITTADVQRVAEELFAPSNLNRLVYQ